MPPAPLPNRPARPAPQGPDPQPRGPQPRGPQARAPQGKGPQSGADGAAAGRPRRPIGVREELEDRDERGPGGFLADSFRESPAFIVSAAVHAIVVVLLMLIILTSPEEKKVEDLVSTPAETDKEEIEEEIEIELPEPEIETEVISQEVVEVQTEEVLDELVEVVDDPAAQLEIELSDIGLPSAPKTDLASPVGKTTGKGFDGRGAAMRAQMVAEYGGTPESERAVALALKWLAAHQNRDGSWNFDHGTCPRHKGPNRNPGTEKSLTGATAMALLPFLGAGQTHKEGKYKDTVYHGLRFLGMKMNRKTGDLSGGSTMYCHGLAAIALCEAYALTQDNSLRQHAQASLDFITYAQDKVGGGWRYHPGQPGDTSVVGWQVMALKSGHLAYLKVNEQTVAGAINFLNIVQQDSGAFYGYTKPGNGPATTAVGLLCRMYLGWKKDEPAMQRGAAWISKVGPSVGKNRNMYFNYYATQIMRHWGGEEWTKWNEVMRDELVSTQITKDPFKEFGELGSWTPGKGNHAAHKGGRLYETSMATMTLEVYYRHMPLYQEAVAEDDF